MWISSLVRRGNGRPAARIQGARERVESIFAAREEAGPRPTRRQLPGQSFADPGRGAGDEDDLAGEGLQELKNSVFWRPQLQRGQRSCQGDHGARRPCVCGAPRSGSVRSGSDSRDLDVVGLDCASGRRFAIRHGRGLGDRGAARRPDRYPVARFELGDRHGPAPAL